MTGQRPALLLSAGVLVALLAAGCVADGRSASTVTPAAHAPSATAPAVEAPSAEATTEVGLEPSASPSADVVSPVPPSPTLDPGAVAGPPVAAVTGPGGAPVEGMLGSYTWLDAGSDAPWLVPPGAQAVQGHGPFTVAFEPDLTTEAWTARWAPVVDGVAGEPALSSSGGREPILVPAPGDQGTWSLQLDVRFANGGRAAWYWRIDTVP